MKQTLTLTFEVDDDLTSERAAEYRAAVIHALSCVQDGDAPSRGDGDVEHYPLVCKLLNDVND